eukprot:CAMPEP_0202708538 /NCGR_PEP_ID=MMETSP1385-20130828/20718_1 /ASSEMBLY_ACC=CAM_ASM_000861 /TAXON_ID=933848 /ORGANISM="Elphidium margaritaceum" /LENGTH=976 /DNA_ID=CAMNT_0049367537 /DNA_START=135 /DNA_END=3065 /DNA_ORIENTATION=+
MQRYNSDSAILKHRGRIYSIVNSEASKSKSRLKAETAAFCPITSANLRQKEMLFEELQTVLAEIQVLQQSEAKLYDELVVTNQNILFYQSQTQSSSLINSPFIQSQYKTVLQQHIIIQQEYFTQQRRRIQLEHELAFKREQYHQIKTHPLDAHLFYAYSANENDNDNDQDEVTPEMKYVENLQQLQQSLQYAAAAAAAASASNGNNMVAAHVVPPMTQMAPISPLPQRGQASQAYIAQRESEGKSCANENENENEDEDESESEYESDSDTASIATHSTAPTHLSDLDDDELLDREFDDDDEDEKDEVGSDLGNKHNLNQIGYSVLTLLEYRPKFMHIEWFRVRNESEYEYLGEIPDELRFDFYGVDPARYMQDVSAMMLRKSSNPWLAASHHAGTGPTDKKGICTKKLRGILNKMTPEKFDKISAQTMECVRQFAENEEFMKLILGCILEFAITISVFGDQYAKLCKHLYNNLQKIRMACEYDWILNDPSLPQTFRQMVIMETDLLFRTYRKHSPFDIDVNEQGEKITDAEELELKVRKKKESFFAVMILVAELFNVDLISEQVVYKGVFEELLPPRNKQLSSIDLDGICRLLKRCGKKLDVPKNSNASKTNSKQSTHLQKYLQRLAAFAKRFDFRTQCIVDEVKEMRNKNWTLRIKKDKAMTIDEVHEKFERERQSNEQQSYYGQRRPHLQQRHGHNYADTRKTRGQSRARNNRRGNSAKSVYKSDKRDAAGHVNAAGGRAQYKPVVDATNTSGKTSKARARKERRSQSMQYRKVQQRPRSGKLDRNSYIDEDADAAYNNHDDFKDYERPAVGNAKDKESVKSKLRSYIEEYLASKVMDDLVEYNCSDLPIWAEVINDCLIDCRPAHIDAFIDLLIKLFEQEILHNQRGKFVDIVVQHLADGLNDSCVDCPMIVQYVAKLLVALCMQQYMPLDAAYNCFRSPHLSKIIHFSIDECKQLGCAQSVAMISNLNKHAV